MLFKRRNLRILSRGTVLYTLSALLLAGCGDAGAWSRGTGPAPEPSFEAVFPELEGELMTMSSPALADLDGDGTLDIVFGTGVDRVVPDPDDEERRILRPEPQVPGYVVAVSGATNEKLWEAPNPGEAFTTPRYADLSGDGKPDVIMGGREGALSAYNGADGSLLWRTLPSDVAETPFPYNFFTPAFIRDVDGDGVADLVVAYGGDDTRPPETARDPGYLAVVSGAHGSVLAAQPTPDGSETYSSPVAYERSDGTEWIVFGTGGETHPGAAYRAPVSSFLDGTFPEEVEQLVEPGDKGVIAPAALVDLTEDSELDIVISTFDGRLVALAGATGEVLWARRHEGEESYHPPAIMRISPDGGLGLFLSRGIGAFPRYEGSVHRVVDAADGRILLEHESALSPAGAPLAVDLTGDGVDEPIFFGVHFPSGQGGRIHILHLASPKVITYDVLTNIASTPVIADPRDTGALELISLSWAVDPDFLAQGDTIPPAWSDFRWQLFRLDLSASPPPQNSWAGYMGSAGNGRYEPSVAKGRRRR